VIANDRLTPSTSRVTTPTGTLPPQTCVIVVPVIVVEERGTDGRFWDAEIVLTLSPISN